MNHMEHFQRLSPNWLQVVRTFSIACDKDLYTTITFPHVAVKKYLKMFLYQKANT